MSSPRSLALAIGLLLACPSWLMAADDTEALEEAEEAASEVEQLPRPELPSRSQLELQRLQQQYPEQFRPLNGQPDSAALYLAANSSTPHGWVFLIPDGQLPADNALLNNLRHSLADQGWHSLSLQLPNPDFVPLHVSQLPPLPESSEEDAAAEQPEDNQPPVEDSSLDEDDFSDELIEPADELPPDADPELVLEDFDFPEEDPWPEETSAYLLAAQQALDEALVLSKLEQPQSPSRLVLLGQGEGAWHAARWQAQHAVAQVLLLIQAKDATEASAPLEQLTGSMTIAIQDYLPANQAQLPAARARQNAASRTPDQQYQQIVLKEPAHSLQQAEIQRRVKGWLHRFSQPPKTKPSF